MRVHSGILATILYKQLVCLEMYALFSTSTYVVAVGSKHIASGDSAADSSGQWHFGAPESKLGVGSKGEKTSTRLVHLFVLLI